MPVVYKTERAGVETQYTKRDDGEWFSRTLIDHISGTQTVTHWTRTDEPSTKVLDKCKQVNRTIRVPQQCRATS